MAIYTLTDEEIKRICDNKNKRAILEFNMIDDDFKKFYSVDSPRKAYNYKDMLYQMALNINDGDINTNEYNNLLVETDYDMEILSTIRRENFDEIDLTRKIMEGLFTSSIRKNANEFEKARYVFDFVTRIFDYHMPELPCDANYSTLFYRNIPKADRFDQLIVTSVGYSGDLANLITSLSKLLGLRMETLNCTFNNELYAINELHIGDKITYIDAASYLEGRKTVEECFLVSRDILSKDNGKFVGDKNRKYTERQKKVLSIGYRNIKVIGDTFSLSSSNYPYDIDSVIMKREKIFPPLTAYDKKIEKKL